MTRKRFDEAEQERIDERTQRDMKWMPNVKY